MLIEVTQQHLQMRGHYSGQKIRSGQGRSGQGLAGSGHGLAHLGHGLA